MLQTIQRPIGPTVDSTAKRTRIQKWVCYAIAMAFLPALTGCGSGAVSSPAETPAPVVVVPITVTPSSLDMSPDIPRTFILAGGTPPYNIASSTYDVFPAVKPTTGTTFPVVGNSFTLLAKAVSVDTVVDITVRDSATTAPATVKLTVKPNSFSVLPSTAVSVTGASGISVGQVGDCPKNTTINYYVFGGQPPYSISSPLPAFVSVSVNSVQRNGGNFVATVNDCGKASIIVNDSFGTRLETAIIEGVRGAVGTAVVTPFTVTPTVLSIACGAADSVKLAGSGTFSASALSAPNFIVTPPVGTLPATVSIGVRSGANVLNPPIEIEFINNSDAATPKPRVTVLVSVTGRTAAGICP